MPRIDPLQLLKCLSVLLTPEGGILSRDEVPRLVNLMTKFSKKLVSKCVYVLILKSTETVLVDMFMAEGGWALIQTWLQDAVQSGNWDLVKEILGLLLITPVDVERLKLNILPKLIKSLSRRDELEGVPQLSTKLVQQWLVIVKGASNPPQQAVVTEKLEIPNTDAVVANIESKENEEKGCVETQPVSTESFYKSAEKEGKVNNRKLSEEKQDAAAEEELVKSEDEQSKTSSKSSKSSSRSKSSSSRIKEKERGKDRNRDKDKGHEQDKDKDKDKNREKDRKSRSSSSSKIRNSGSVDEKDKDKRHKDRSDREKDRSDKDKERSDKDKDRSDKDKYKHRANGSSKSSSSSSKDKKDSKEKSRDKDKQADSGKNKPSEKEADKDNQAEKDKDTLAIIKPPTIDKLGRIPKKASSVVAPTEEEVKEAKKKAFSIGVVRKDREERPKTVKIFHSKMRSTGLEEEVKPAPARPVKKPAPSLQLPTIPMKRPSPPRDVRDPIVPPEKKLRMDKIDLPDRPGAIKLIPPKPKPLLQESDLFMDAITAATTKKEPKKRKRRLSVTKDNNSTSPSSSPSREQSQTPTSPTQTAPNTSPLGLKNIAPFNFYQDTLTEEKEEKEENTEKAENDTAENAEEKAPIEDEATEKTETSGGSPPRTPTDENQEEVEVESKRVKLDGQLKGVLLYTKKKGPKRSISWKNETDLVEIRYFELDETERVNVTKTFGDMAKMDISSEREVLQQSRKVGGEDSMEAQIMWRIPFIIDQEDALVIPGNKSLEKDIQFAREKSVLQALYFDKRRIPDSPEEPIPENHQMSDPIHIPLEDPEGLEMDMRSTPWPEPKGFAPLPEPVMPPMFPNIQGPYNQPFNNMPPPAFQGLPPRFAGPGGPMGPVVPNNFVAPNVMPSANMMGPGPNHPNHPNHPNMMPPNEMMMNQMNPMNPNMFPTGPMNDGFGQGPDFPMFGNPTGPQNMFPPTNNFNNNHRSNNRGSGGGGGGFRRGRGNDNGGNWRMSGGAGNWRRGGGHRGGRMCKNVQNHGYCRNRDTCPFVHP